MKISENLKIGKSAKKPYLALSAIALALMLLPVTVRGVLDSGNPFFYFFGSEGDWLSQHVGAAELLRQTMLEEKTILPQFLGAGGGCSSYDLAYYGLLRPDVILSCIFPEVGMKWFVAGYMMLTVIASASLSFFWLSAQNLSCRTAFTGSMFLVCATCFWHSHHQIMFVNYMPFLLLALMGVDRLIKEGRSGLLIVSLVLICLHSFYYSPACLTVCFLYWLYRVRAERPGTWKLAIKKGSFAVVTALLLAAVLLLPTAVDILVNGKDSGSFGDQGLKLVDVTFRGLLYHPYGCGMTLIALAALLVTLFSPKCADRSPSSLSDRSPVRQKQAMKLLAAVLLFVMAVPAVSLVLNGFLYARAKILIPFLPLVVLVLSHWTGEWENKKYGKKWVIPLILLIPVTASLTAGFTEEWIPAEDQRMERFTQAEMDAAIPQAERSRYRFDVLRDGLAMANTAGINGRTLQKTAMYSSITNWRYAQFFYNTMGNAIFTQNRVALLPGENPFFNYFMGIRYIQTREDKVPVGYEMIAESEGYVLAENQNVLPVCYGTISFLSEEAFDELDFGQQLEALCSRAVVADTGEGDAEEFVPKIRRVTALEKAEEPQILLIRFGVTRKTGKEVVISIGNVKNKLSSASAPYPNENHLFTYILASEDGLLPKVREEEENYMAAEPEIWTLPASALVPAEEREDLTFPEEEAIEASIKDSLTALWKGQLIFSGTISMEEDGWFITSWPYRDGYQFLVDGEEQEASMVNTAFVGTEVCRGVHKIQLRFQVPGLRTGLLLSLLGLVLVLKIYRKERNDLR